MNYEGNGCKVWRGYNDLIGLYGLGLIMIQVRFVNIRESGFRIPDSGKRTGIFVLARSRFSALETEIQVPLTKNTKPSTWNLESGIHAVEFRIQDYLTWGSFGVTQGITLQWRIQGGGRPPTPPPYLKV